MSLKGEIVFITGASAGIGAATAFAFAAEGAKLLLAARRTDTTHSGSYVWLSTKAVELTARRMSGIGLTLSAGIAAAVQDVHHLSLAAREGVGFGLGLVSHERHGHEGHHLSVGRC